MATTSASAVATKPLASCAMTPALTLAQTRIRTSRHASCSRRNLPLFATLCSGARQNLKGQGRATSSRPCLVITRATEPNKDPSAPPEPEGDLGILPNTGRYALYFVSVLTGTAYVAFRPVFKFMSGSPLKTLAVIGFAVLSYYSVSFVVEAMLGLNGDPFGGPVRGGIDARY